MPVAVQASLGKLSLSGIGPPANSVVITTLITMTATTKAILLTGAIAAVSLPFALHRAENKPAPVSSPNVVKSSPAKPKPKSKVPEMSDEEMFNHLFGGDSDRLRNARSLVDDYRDAYPGKSLRELAQDLALTAKLTSLMQEMVTDSEAGKQFGEAMQLAMQVKGMKPSPGTNISLNMGDGFLSNESHAERHLGAVLSNDAKALAQFITDLVNEAAVELALDPCADRPPAASPSAKDHCRQARRSSRSYRRTKKVAAALAESFAP